jgi:hypothetical protein
MEDMSVMEAVTRLKSVSTMAVLAGALALAAPAAAQVTGLGYGIAGPAGYSGFFGSSGLNVHAAGGGEALAGGRVGAGGEFGLLAGPGGGLFVTSLNGVFHFAPSSGARGPDQRVSPFVSGGYTRMFSGEGSFNGFNAGAGADIWLKPRLGIRAEVRDHIRPDSRGGVHYWAVRVGVVFR